MTKAVSATTSSSSWPQLLAPSPTKDPHFCVQRDNASDKIVSVPAMMNYVHSSTKQVSTRRNLAGSDDKLEGANWLPTLVNVYNARDLDCTLDKDGFELVTRQKVSSLEIDFLDQRDVVDRYYPKCEDLLQSVLSQRQGKSQKVLVKAFDHNVRIGSSTSTNGRGSNNTDIKNSNGALVQNPAGLVHADYTRVSAPRRVKDLTKPPKQNDVLKDFITSISLLENDMVQEVIEGKQRFALVNVWRNIDSVPIQQLPLACIHARTVTFEDLRTFQIHYADRIGENYFCCPCLERHKWCFFPDMTMDEALLLKQWDSHGGMAQGQDCDSDISSFTVHSAFVDPTSPSDAFARKSIEVRCVAIWDD